MVGGECVYAVQINFLSLHVNPSIENNKNIVNRIINGKRNERQLTAVASGRLTMYSIVPTRTATTGRHLKLEKHVANMFPMKINPLVSVITSIEKQEEKRDN